jgi:hypothetical protein
LTILFLQKIADYKKDSYNYKRKSDHHYNAEAHPHGMIHGIIVSIDKRAKTQANHNKYDSADKFPFPG